ncbi:adenylyl-sulfate kinase [Dokdonella sp. MW10]|uniref:adenylyl-sulfate kinase n=1 Tax=Dokdonella sp. MW10 TaxID=2992926 RepID=UPI003F81EE69
MTSGADAIATRIAPILWITGLAGTGKTRLATAVVAELRARGIAPLLLDGDQVREALEPAAMQEIHDAATRRERAWRIARLARLAALQDIPVVVATISLLHAVQAWNRAGPAPYAEVLLTAGEAELRRRRPHLYSASDVVGRDIVAEFPLHPELVLDDVAIDAPSARLARVMDVWNGLQRA